MFQNLLLVGAMLLAWFSAMNSSFAGETHSELQTIETLMKEMNRLQLTLERDSLREVVLARKLGQVVDPASINRIKSHFFAGEIDAIQNEAARVPAAEASKELSRIQQNRIQIKQKLGKIEEQLQNTEDLFALQPQELSRKGGVARSL